MVSYFRIINKNVLKIRENIICFGLSHTKLVRQIKKYRFPLNEVIFRPIGPNDENQYFEFMRDYFKDNPSDRAKERLMPVCNENTFFYIAIYQKRIIGVIRLRKIAIIDSDPWQLNGIGILPEFRSCGIGEKLLKTGILAIKEKNLVIFLDVLKNNRPAINLYEKLGFKITEERQKFEVDDIGYPLEKLVMVLKN